MTGTFGSATTDTVANADPWSSFPACVALTTHVPLKPVIVTTPRDKLQGPDTVITAGSPDVARATGVKLVVIGAEAGTPLNVMVWASLATATPNRVDVIDLNTASAAFVAVIEHEPVPWVRRGDE